MAAVQVKTTSRGPASAAKRTLCNVAVLDQKAKQGIQGLIISTVPMILFGGLERRFDMKLRVTDMNASYEITIRTQFSDYRFRVTDPVQCRGFLTGGPLGNQQHDAFLAEVLPASVEGGEPFRLATGYRAVFFIGGNGFRRLTTSIITEISVAQSPANVLRS